MVGDEPLFLGFGAFETTAFCTAILVALYSLIPNPEGRQGTNDQAEYEVYSGWRRALAIVFAQLMLMIAVLAYICLNRASARAAWWVVALMMTPWAPLSGRVRRTLSSWDRVRVMMINRHTRNEVAAIMRDRFKFGQRGIAIPLIINYAYSGKKLPVYPISTLRAHEVLGNHIVELTEQAMEAAGISDGKAIELGVLWGVNQGRQPNSMGKREVFSRLSISRVDLLARAWTRHAFPLICDPFPKCHPPVGDLAERARILDTADSLQQGGTIGDELMNRAMKKRFCLRCQIATRGAVETFLESSVRSHTDLRAKDWLRHISMQWKGNFEKVMDVMWEAAFMEQDANRVDFYEDDRSPAFGDRSKVMTTKTLALLFMITRSLMGKTQTHTPLSRIGQLVKSGLNTQSWWEDYWNRVTVLLGAEDDLVGGPVKISENARAVFKKALRDSVDDDMQRIIHFLIEHPTRNGICVEENCELSTKTRMIVLRIPESKT